MRLAATPIQLAAIPMQLAAIPMQLAAIPMQLAAIPMQLAAIPMQLAPQKTQERLWEAWGEQSLGSGEQSDRLLPLRGAAKRRSPRPTGSLYTVQ
eukprot:gene10057-biopygen1933